MTEDVYLRADWAAKRVRDALKEVLMVKRANWWWWLVLNSVEALQEVLMVKRADWWWWEGEQD